MLTQTQTVSRAASFKHPVAGFRHAPPAGKEPPADTTRVDGCADAVCAQ